MTLSELRSAARAMIPGSGNNTDGPLYDTVLDLMLNEGVKDIAVYTKCLPTNKKFNIVADQFEYVLSTVIGDYICPDKPGLYWNQGTVLAPNYKKLDPETIASLDLKYPLWRDRDSNYPMAYTIDGDTLTITPPPLSSLASALWLYYCKKPTIMSALGHYPFTGSTTELTHLSMFDMAILYYARMKISPMLNKETNENISLIEYTKEREEKAKLLLRRADISNITQFKGKL
jgi:hypothetical protein